MVMQLISVFIGVVGFALVLEVQKKYLVYCGIAGTVGWAAYLLGHQFLPVGSVFFSSFCIALLSQIFARKLRCPVTVFLIPGIYPSDVLTHGRNNVTHRSIACDGQILKT